MKRCLFAVGLMLGCAVPAVAPTPVPKSLQVGAAPSLPAPGVSKHQQVELDDRKRLQEFWSSADQWLEPLLRDGLLDGVAVGVVSGSQTEFRGYGSHKPNDRSLFEIGSITKVFTAGLMASETLGDDLSVDTRVGTLLRPGALHSSARDLTLAHLLGHRSGYPNFPPQLPGADPHDPWRNYGVEALYAFVGHHALSEPGAQRVYSTLGMSLVAQLLEQHSGQSYAQLIESRIAGPLGMTDTQPRALTDAGAPFMQGHHADGQEVSDWHLNGLVGGGGLVSSTRDLLVFIRENLKPDPTSKVGATLLRLQSYGDKGWGWAPSKKKTLWHNGQTGGFHSFLALDRGRQVGLVVLANTAALIVDPLSVKLMEVLRGESPEPFVARSTVKLPTSVLRSYEGRYSFGSYGVCTIAVEGHNLVSRVPGFLPQRLYASGDDQFFLRGLRASVRFTRSTDGSVTSAVLSYHKQEIAMPRLL